MAKMVESNMVVLITFLLVFAVYGSVLLSITEQFLRRKHVVSTNYRGQVIPNAMGVYIWIMILFYFLFILVVGKQFLGNEIFNPLYEHEFILFPIVVSCAFFFGWLDDLYGDHTVKGLKGHIECWMHHGVITSGLIKAIGIGILSIGYVVIVNQSIYLMVLQVLLLPLMTNTFNLLDLRPGRTIKVFFVVLVFLFSIEFSWESVLYLFPSMLAALLLFPGDMKGRFMLGDAGSNMLGFITAIAVTKFTPWWNQIILLVIVLFIHWYAERKSITQFIERHRFIYWIDQWGRG